MKLTVFSSDGKTSSEKDFAGLPTFEGDKGLQAVKEVIVAINANNRQGTHSTKTRRGPRPGSSSSACPGSPPGHALDEDPGRGPRRRQEAVAPEGHRPRPRRLHPL